MTSKDANRQAVKVLYDLEMGLWEMDMSNLSYDEDQDCFRFKDGRFAFSRTQADWKFLEEVGYAP
jgi:hypothetical protein